VICGLQGTSEGRKSNEKYKASFKSGGVLQRPSCSGHQQNAEIAGKITIMRESFRPSRQISKGSRVKAAKHQAGSGSLRYHTHSRRILLAI